MIRVQSSLGNRPSRARTAVICTIAATRRSDITAALVVDRGVDLRRERGIELSSRPQIEDLRESSPVDALLHKGEAQGVADRGGVRGDVQACAADRAGEVS